MNTAMIIRLAAGVSGVAMGAATATLPYVVIDTGQERCYDLEREIAYPASSESPWYGQDAQYAGSAPAYVDNGDGTVTDTNTGLMWQQDPGEKRTYPRAVADAAECRTGGYTDWRLPTIKELYSLILFNGTDPDPMGSDTSGQRPFIDTRYFTFAYGERSEGERVIDAQYVSSTRYVGTTMGGQKTVFGVNFADGRIKGYGTGDPRGRGEKAFCVLYVRGHTRYGQNDFLDHGDDTVTDRATGLTWMKADSGRGMNWADALAYAEGLELAGHTDWRLPNAKELQSLVDYGRSPDTTDSAAIDPVFEVSAIRNECGEKDYPSFWTGTTHVRAGGDGRSAVYVAFGRGMGCMRGRWMDVHGAGCQRSDPKEGNPAAFPQGRGPQGDAIRIHNYVRCVRGDAADPRIAGPEVEPPIPTRGRGRVPGPELRTGEPDPRHPGGRPSGFVQRLDRNGDGKVSRQEFDGPSDHFQVLDQDDDGFLVESEAPPLPSRMGGPDGPAGSRGDRPGR